MPATTCIITRSPARGHHSPPAVGSKQFDLKSDTSSAMSSISSSSRSSSASSSPAPSCGGASPSEPIAAVRAETLARSMERVLAFNEGPYVMASAFELPSPTSSSDSGTFEQDFYESLSHHHYHTKAISTTAKGFTSPQQSNNGGKLSQQQQQSNKPERRFTGGRRPSTSRKNRHYSSSMANVNSTTMYPCSLCAYGYPQLTDYGSRTRDATNFRNRSFSASQTSLQSDVTSGSGSGSAPTVLSLAECAYLYTNYRKRSSLYNLTTEDPDILTIGDREFDLHNPRFDVLSFEQVKVLSSVLEQPVQIKTNMQPELVKFPLLKLILEVRRHLLDREIVLHDIRLNGGAASHVLSMNSSAYNDIDLIFFVDLKDGFAFERVREAVLDTMSELVPAVERRHVIETFVNKMVKVNDADNRWSLISLNNHAGRNVELKFVDKMRRQYEFSVDSFQIVLDTLLQFFSINSCETHPMTLNFYPTVVGESVFGNFCEAMVHLHHRLIVTKNPEEIRGGGLLKYCTLLVRNFHPIDDRNAKVSEPYMCTRFLIDFIYYDFQRDKLTNYLTTHFGDDYLLKYNFMITFTAIVKRSSSLASHHASSMYEFERHTLECYSRVLCEYLDIFMTDPLKVHDFFVRCQEMRVCNCPKSNRACIHRYLNPVYSLTSPLVVTFVDDSYDETVSKEERRQNLAKFIDKHDEMIPIYGGFTFAYLPSVLFDCVESSHYVVSSSTLKSIPSARYINAEPPPPTDYMCTFLMKPGAGPQPMMQIIPLGVQNLLPKSFHPVDYANNPNLITPSMAYHFFPPIAPPHQYRLCIVNRIPIYTPETLASGPIFNSQIMSMHFTQSAVKVQQPSQPQQADTPTTQVSLSQFMLSPLYTHVHQHAHHVHNHAHHHGYHAHQHYGAQYGNGYRGKKYQQQHSQPNSNGHSGHHHYYQSQMSLPACHIADSHAHHQQMEPIEPLRIIYPRTPSPPTGADLQQPKESRQQQSQAPKLVIPQISINDQEPLNFNASDLVETLTGKSHAHHHRRGDTSIKKKQLIAAP